MWCRGVTTNSLDKLAHDYITQVQGCIPAPLNYRGGGNTPYPKSICTSVNHQVCHGIPNDKPLKKGDIVNIDVTVIKDGWHGDTSRMFIVGETSIAARRLCNLTYEAMWRGIVMVKPGRTWATLACDPEVCRRAWLQRGARILRPWHWAVFHEEPQVLHYGKPGTLEELKPGMTFTIEPMINAGRKDIKDGEKDGWTIVTKDHSLSAQWEHTVLVTPTGYEVLTLSAGSPPSRILSRSPEAPAARFCGRAHADPSTQQLRDRLPPPRSGAAGHRLATSGASTPAVRTALHRLSALADATCAACGSRPA
jgi:methionyl aminopeptidase